MSVVKVQLGSRRNPTVVSTVVRSRKEAHQLRVFERFKTWWPNYPGMNEYGLLRQHLADLQPAEFVKNWAYNLAIPVGNNLIVRLDKVAGFDLSPGYKVTLAETVEDPEHGWCQLVVGWYWYPLADLEIALVTFMELVEEKSK